MSAYFLQLAAETRSQGCLKICSCTYPLTMSPDPFKSVKMPEMPRKRKIISQTC
jgi:hypothetical protein